MSVIRQTALLKMAEREELSKVTHKRFKFVVFPNLALNGELCDMMTQEWLVTQRCKLASKWYCNRPFSRSVFFLRKIRYGLHHFTKDFNNNYKKKHVNWV